ncbi:PREDICTED: putative sodium-coupled neutral amino acid transporter 11 isoform X2 [Rhagoletis zephyria]|uniref:putative sodium-coupled neutral amino acid transporter 11 isoform X2 n=1 Tax=Rhagoletis zephyria TaxID=28612 RepID=UPI00081147CC|nr:PREDICTED: putative sodium-coupled neutral amino acid transporter 11 isoform X2 [Rhagoletis zephyria]
MSNSRRNTATEFSYVLQRQGSDVSASETHAFDDISNLMEAKHCAQHQQSSHTGGGGQYIDSSATLDGDALSSLPQASFNYINSIVGSGVIGIPYALHRAGFGLGLLLLVLVAFITDYSLILMVRCGHICGRFSYPGIMEAAYGKYGYYLLSILQFMYPFLAFMCHHNTFLVYQSMRNATLERWEKVTHVSIGFALAVAALFGIAGYSTFRALSQGDLLENYCWNDDLMNFSRVLFSVSILLTFPIECFVSREIVRALIHRFVLKEPISELTLDKDPNLEKGADIDEYSRNITLAIVLSAFIISPLTDCLGSVLELNGLLAAIPLAYILPGLAFIQMDSHHLFSREKLPALGLVVFGTFVTILGVAVLLPGLMGDCRSDVVMDYCEQEFTELTGTNATE